MNSVAQVRVFASFDCEKDEKLLRRLVDEGKSPGSHFTVVDRSTNEAPTAESRQRLCERISKVDAMIVLCGVWTHLSPNVNAEVKMAQELGKRYYLIKGHRFRECARPSAARITDKMFKWSKGTADELALRNL